MKRVLMVGAGLGGTTLLHFLFATNQMSVVALIDHDKQAKGMAIANEKGIPTDVSWKDWLHQDIDIIFDVTGDEQVFHQLMKQKYSHTVVIPGAICSIMTELLVEKESLLEQLRQQTSNQELILDNIRDGMIVVNEQEVVQFMNKSAKAINDINRDDFVGKPVQDIISLSGLPRVLKTEKREVNQRLTLENGKKVISTRIPMINKQEKLIGAFAVFKDITEVVQLAEENTDLTEIKTMLEAVIQSSDEAISVVDEYGNGIMINPAYTRITGLKESDIIGKPATSDIASGESMHLKVLKTGKRVHGVHMKVGSMEKDVLVNASPVIVDGVIRGSVGVLHDVTEIQTLTTELNQAKKIIRNLEAKYTFRDIIGISEEMKLALEQAKVGARTPATVLLRGESGTGKELFAHAIHNESSRSDHTFIRVNCATIAPGDLEGKLFGYAEGLNQKGRKGLFEEADKGSIFLDEIGELSLHMQARLLRVVQENEMVRIGGTRPITIDVRIIASTNINLEKAIMTHEFREDLYYRLNRLPIFIPPVRERMDDLPVLIDHLIAKINIEYGRNVKGVSDDTADMFQAYHWPGNVRELENVLSRAIIFMDIGVDVITSEYLPRFKEQLKKRQDQQKQNEFAGMPLQLAIEDYERDYIREAYERNRFNKTQTAKELNISIRNLYYKLQKYQLD